MGTGQLPTATLTASIVHYGTSEGNLDLTATGDAEVPGSVNTVPASLPFRNHSKPCMHHLTTCMLDADQIQILEIHLQINT